MMNLKLITRVNALFLLIFTTGCATVMNSSSVKIPETNQESTLANYRLPKKLIVIDIKGDQSDVATSNEFRVDLQEETVPDPDALYQLTYDPSLTSSDEIEVKLENGLLKEIKVSADDQTGNVLIELAKGLSFAATAVGEFQIPAAGPSSATNDLMTVIFDPTDTNSTSDAQNTLGNKFKLSVNTPSGAPAIPVPKKCDYSICYRIPRAVTVSLLVIKTGIIIQKTFAVPNNSIVTGVDIDRSLFVKRDRKVTFDNNGNLTLSTDNKPSEALAAAKLPLAIMKGIFAGINDALGELTGLSKGNKNALDAKKNELEAAAALTDKIIEIEKARKPDDGL